ncbi:MAG: thioredoxin [Chlamydiae bacterium]|jgi:thioredoxin 1|nr:thioredoxin [Chlamydiota bacterium]
MTVQEVSKTEVEEKIKAGKLILIDFYAEWCGPCKQISPILDDLEKEANGAYEIYKIDVDKDEAREFLTEQMVMSIPTVVFFKDGKRVDSFVGLQDKDTIKKMIAKINQM